jgi:hypothetical protein
MNFVLRARAFYVAIFPFAAMQRFLTKLTAEQAEQQQQRIAAEATAAVAVRAAAVVMRPAARGPGRPRLSAAVLAWTLAAWNYLASPAGKEMILKGWFKCVHAHFDVLDADQRKKAVTTAVKGELKAYDFVPAEEEPEKHGEDVWHSDSERELDEEDDDLDLTKPIVTGERKSKRARCDRQRQIGPYMLDSSRIELSDDEES